MESPRALVAVIATLALLPSAASARPASDEQARRDAVRLTARVFSIATHGDKGVSSYTEADAFHPKKGWLIIGGTITSRLPSAPREEPAYRFFTRTFEGLRGPLKPPVRLLEPARSQGVILSGPDFNLALLRDNGSSFCPESHPELCDVGTRGWTVRASYVKDNKVLVIEAATRPGRGERALSGTALGAFYRQALSVVGDAEAHRATTNLSPAFPRIAGERDPRPPLP